MLKRGNLFALFVPLFFVHSILCGSVERFDPFSGTKSIEEKIVQPLSEKIEQIVEKGTEVVKEMVGKTSDVSSKVYEFAKEYPRTTLTAGAGVVVTVFWLRKYLKKQDLEQNIKRVEKGIEEIKNLNITTQGFHRVGNKLKETEQKVDDLKSVKFENEKSQKLIALVENLTTLFVGTIYGTDKTTNNESSSDDSHDDTN